MMTSVDHAPRRPLRSRSVTAAARGAVTSLRRIPLPLAILFAVAVGLRVAMSLVYHPAVMNNADSSVYVSMAAGELFSDPVRPAGYSIFLRGMHALSADLDLTIAVQHLLGFATALLLYGTVRRIGAPRWPALVAAAAVLLSLDQISLEHSVLAEPLFISLCAVALYTSVRGLDSPRTLAGPLSTRHGWIALAGIALGFATWARGAGIALIPFVALWFVFALPGRWFERLGRGALAAGSAVAILLVYFSLHSSATGYFGLTESSGWALYGRVGQFADCSKFQPPEGTEELCEDSPADARPGPDFYTWTQDSPAQRLFGYPPTEDAKLAAFARQAIQHQPLSYAYAVVSDTLEYFAPGFHDERRFSGPRYDTVDVARREPGAEQHVETTIRAYYPAESLTIGGGVARLSDLQQILRVHPVLMLQAVVLAVFGICLAAGRVRAGLVLLLGAGLLQLVLAAAVGGYNARYAIPPGGPLVAAGAIGLWVILQRWIERHDASATAAAPHT